MDRKKKFIITIKAANGSKLYISGFKDKEKQDESATYGSTSDALIFENEYEVDQIVTKMKKRVPSVEKELII